MLEIRDIISIVCLCIGLFFCLTTTIGLYRLPDFYSRCHTAVKQWPCSLCVSALSFSPVLPFYPLRS